MSNLYQIYLISDATGETLDRIFTAIKAQFKNIDYKIHTYSFTRTENQILKILENAEKITAELVLAIKKSKTVTTNVAISIPVTSAIIRVVTAPLMKDDELQKAIETNSLWENLVQLTDNLAEY